MCSSSLRPAISPQAGTWSSLRLSLWPACQPIPSTPDCSTRRRSPDGSFLAGYPLRRALLSPSMTMREKLELLERHRASSEVGGGAARLAAQHAKGKLSARERLDLLLDDGSFVELDRFVVHRSHDFGLEADRP